MPEQDPQDDLRAADLLPPDSDLAPPVRKIAERRVVGWSLSNRLITRFERRPCGNSRRFWKQIEEDDPFRPKPALKRIRQDHTLYPVDRMDRIPSTAIPQDKPAARRPTPQAQRAVPKPQAPPPTPPPRAPEPVHTPDPRSAQSPLPPRPQPAPPPEAPKAPIDRRPPIVPRGGGGAKAGRIRVSRATERPHGQTGVVPPRPSAAEVRERKNKEREAGTTKDHGFKNRPLDDVLSILGQLGVMEKLHAEGRLEEDHKVQLPDAPAPKKPSASEAKAAPAPPAAPPPSPAPKPAAPTPPAPRPETPPVDRTPPPAAKPKAEPTRPGPPPSAGNMNDIFGGDPNEGRVRIGRRQKTTKKD